MGIFFLSIPLVLFIIAEGIIFFFLIRTVTSDLLDNTGIHLAPLDVLLVFLMIVAIGLTIYFYVRLIIRPAILHKRKRKNPENYSSNTRAANPNGKKYDPYIENYLSSVNSNNPRSPNKLKVTGVNYPPVKKKKSKKLLIILILIAALIIGSVVCAYIFKPDWLPFDLPFFGESNKDTGKIGTQSDIRENKFDYYE